MGMDYPAFCDLDDGQTCVFFMFRGWVNRGAVPAPALGRDRQPSTSRTQRVDSRSGRCAGGVATDRVLPDTRRASSDDSHARRVAACAVVIDRSVAAKHAARVVEAGI